MQRIFSATPRSSLVDRLRNRPELRVETLVALLSVYFILFCNSAFWQNALAGRDAASASSWLFAAMVGVALAALHFFCLVLVSNRWTIKPLMTVLILATGAASYFTAKYHVYYDTSMVRNVLKTDPKEASELLTMGLFLHLLLVTSLPLVVLWRSRIKRVPIVRAVLQRLGWMLVALLAAVCALLLVFQSFSALMRNNPALRHLITPGNFVVSLIKVVAADQQRPAGPKTVVGADAKLGASWAERKRPTVLVLVVGETARAANWGLNGYSRQTTPELAALNVLNFSQVTSCGTNTEVSVPCMFSPFGRHDYDETKIKTHESLLHVLNRAKLDVTWRDNQSGCKGVCSDLKTDQLDNDKDPKLCADGRCLDEILLKDLDQRIAANPGSMVVVLHQLGNHGPAYYERYPAAQKAYTPVCETSELGKCQRQEIVNGYDNAIRYTDHFLAQAIRLLQTQTSHDAALVYVSDHGESLGENGVYLHGLPRAIAPAEQTHVPMIMWLSQGYAESFKLKPECLRQKSAEPLSHDNLFHTLLGMLDVSTQVYDRGYDFTASCRQ
ncbi:phosphoethanolamine--lipid A transferase [Chitinimonas sp.]|uniref:phosphoethanolamine transferase n=1 Tax=Chitinimonas sp. TaxID=1934313 RepID=UPI002F929EB8